VSLLDRKLLRDLVAMRGQVITIALVVAAGVGVFVASISTYESLWAGRDQFYAEGRFPQIFVSLKRAPLAIVAQLSEISGVATIQPRIVRDVVVDWPTSPLPVSARIVSIANSGDEPLARLHLRRGTAPSPGDTRSAAVNEAFADANSLQPGSDLRVILNGRVQSFTITGVALSPEYVYAVKPGLPLPDDRFFAVLWIDRRAAESAFDMTGAFNDLVASLAPGADAASVVAELDRLLAPFGSAGAITARDQSSNRILEDELNQQRVMSTTIPITFFAIAAFLLNIALGRLVTAQREQIAALKALGFPNAPLAFHYFKLVTVVVLLGTTLGIAVGIAFGEAVISSYNAFFRLPVLEFELVPWSVTVGFTISFAAATIGVLSALRAVVSLAPAEAMRAAAPSRFRRTAVETLLSMGRLRPRLNMMLRNITGHPLRTALTVLGIALAIPMVALGLFWRDAIDEMIDVQFNLVERGNMVVSFPQPRSRNIIGNLAREPGVLAVEGQRIVPVRLRAGHRSYLTSVIGLPPDSELRRPHDSDRRPIDVAANGITLTRRLAERLDTVPGNILTVEVLEGRRRIVDLPVAASVDEPIGMSAYMQIDALNYLTGEGDVVSAAAIYSDPAALPLVSRWLKELPIVESVSMKAYTLASFLDKIAGLVFVTAGILTGFAVIIAVGVVYNSARIGLQERAWELASLRVLGFTRGEVSSVLFGEFIIEIACAVPLGLLLTQHLIDWISRVHSNESFQIPATVGARTYSAAVIVVAVAAMASAYIVRRRIDRLDLVSALKARD
jgi:putative ABC transport system permease protein